MSDAPLNTLRRQLAAIEHERWVDWQRWMHDQCDRQPNGELIIPAALVERWERQIATPFEQLNGAEQQSDLDQVDRYWPLIGPALERAEAVEAARDEACRLLESHIHSEYDGTSQLVERLAVVEELRAK